MVPATPHGDTDHLTRSAPLDEAQVQQRQLDAGLANRYRIIRKLGTGGMATVYLARDLKHDRDVALEVLKPNVSESLGRDRFVREIRMAARLTHPHRRRRPIVAVRPRDLSDGVAVRARLEPRRSIRSGQTMSGF